MFRSSSYLSVYLQARGDVDPPKPSGAAAPAPRPLLRLATCFQSDLHHRPPARPTDGAFPAILGRKVYRPTEVVESSSIRTGMLRDAAMTTIL